MHWLRLLFVTLAVTSAAKLNYPRVRLPIFAELSIDFTLEVIEGGCFKWTSSRPDLIAIKPITDDAIQSECSSRAVVTTVSHEFRRSTAIVLVEDLNTGEVLRCDVILDVIHQLDVHTTTRELYLEEAPETYELLAIDDQGNVFSTLEGIAFDWKIAAQHSNSAALKFLKFAESPYHEVPRAVAQFERTDARGFMVLIEGINTGSARVIARLPQSEYAHVAPVEVDIMVLANIILDPVDAHILVGDTIAFRILQLKQGKLHEITSNAQYYLEIEDTTLATITGNLAQGSKLGSTSVILRDRNVRDSATSSPSPRATLTITSAAKITLDLLPHHNWLTIQAERHDIAVDLYSPDNHRIHLGDRFMVNAQFDESIFYPMQRTRNGSRVYGEAATIGSSHVQATFEGLSASAELIVYADIALSPMMVVLPLDPNNPKKQLIKFTASGCDNSFTWSSNKPKHVHVSATGVADVRLDVLSADLSLHTAAAGDLAQFAKVTVALVRNPKITKSALLFFVPPHQLRIVQYNFETSLGDYVDLHIAVYSHQTGHLEPFTHCDNLNFDLDFSNPIFQVANASGPSELGGAPCRRIRLKASSLGQTQLRVSYTFGDKVLKDDVTLVVFEKLNILNPISNEIVLPIGSSRNVIYHHGPQKLFSVEAELKEETHFDANIASVTRIPNEANKDKHAFTVLCKQVGQTELTLELHNAMATENVRAYVSAFRTTIHCVKPRFINLFTTEKLRSSCPLNAKNSMMHVKSAEEHQLEVGVEVLDAENRRLMNISSLVVDWQYTLSDDAQQQLDVAHRLVAEDELLAGVKIPVRDVLRTDVPDVLSNYKIKASVVSYDREVLRALHIVSEHPEFGVQRTSSEGVVKPTIENELNFLTVNRSLLLFDSISIFLSKNRQERVPLAQGSGYYEITLSEQGIISAELGTNELVITPLRFGHVSVELTDRCLMEEPSVLHVSVVSIGKIEVQIPDRVEKTKSIEAIVRLYDSLDNLLVVDSKDLRAYDLHQNVFNANITAVKLDQQHNLGVGEIRYKVTGLELGETKIVFSAGTAEQLVKSPAATVQVFPPLRLFPRNSSIIVGTNVQIHSHGGPHPDVNIVYTVDDDKVISMDSALATALRLGTTTITGKCVGISPATGRQIVFSQDSVQINVVPLDKIKIVTPLIRIRSGAIMPATLWGVPDISPMILGTLSDLSVVWSTNQPDVISVFGVFADAGIEYGSHDAISVRVKALNPGKAKLQATVVTPQGKQNLFVEVVVFQMLELESPKRIVADTILIPPNFQSHLKANLADTMYNVDARNGGNVVSVTHDGNLQSGETIGRDVIIASSGDQTLSIPVEVKNIHYLLATLHTSTLKLKQPATQIPRGVQLVLKVTLHDNLGNEFWHHMDDVNSLRTKLSRREMADIHVGDNFTIGINLPRESTGMLSVSLKNPIGVKYAEDFVKLSVAQSTHIFPPQSTVLTVGDVVCFESPLAYSNNWRSSDENVLRVDSSLGVGRLLATRSQIADKITVTNGDRQLGHIKFDLEVRAADHVHFTSAAGVFNGATAYRAPLLIRSQLQTDKESNMIARNRTKCAALVDSTHLPPSELFACKLRPSPSDPQQSAILSILSVIETVPVFDQQTGFYACQVSPKSGQTVGVDRELQLELEVRLASGISDSIPLRVTPSIQVVPRLLQLENLPKQMITVKGLDDVLSNVEVTASNPDAIEVVLASKTHQQLQYRARVIGAVDESRSLYLLIASPRSQQSVRVPIQTLADISSIAGGQCGSQPLFNLSGMLVSVASNVGLIVSVIVVLAAVVWGFVHGIPSKTGGGSVSEAFANNDSFRKNGNQTLIHPPQPQPLGPAYPNTSSSFSSPTSRSPNNSAGVDSLDSSVYGHSTPVSPERRVNRRYF